MLTFNDIRQQDYSFPSSDPLFLKLEILKIHDIFKLKIGKFIYKCLNKNTPINFHNWFILTTHIHNYNTRSKFIGSDNLINTKKLFIPTSRTLHYGLKKIKVLGSKIWNQFPPSIRINTSFGLFNTELKIHLIGNYRFNNQDL